MKFRTLAFVFVTAPVVGFACSNDPDAPGNGPGNGGATSGSGGAKPESGAPPLGDAGTTSGDGGTNPGSAAGADSGMTNAGAGGDLSAGAGGDAENETNVAGAPTSSSGTGGTGGGTGGTGGGTGGTGGGTGGTVCNSIVNDGAEVLPSKKSGEFPKPQGGTIVDGTYHLVGWDDYPGSGDGPNEKWRVTLLATGSTIQLAVSNSLGLHPRYSLTVESAAKTFKFTCPTYQGSVGFTSTPTTIDILQEGALRVEHYLKE